MPEVTPVMPVKLSPNDLLPTIQRKGREQDIWCEGAASHVAFTQAQLMLEAEQLLVMLTRIVRGAKKAKERSPLKVAAVSDAML